MAITHSRVFWSISPFAVSVLLATRVFGSESPKLEDLLKMPLEEMANVRVTVASHFVESQLNSGSTVSVITEDDWKRLGARRTSEAIGNLPSTIVLPNWFGAEQIYIRGYADGNNSGGVATLWDGVAINPLEGGPQFYRQNINLGTLDRIEMIRGPGSALYGENAFHGALSLHAFESQRDVTRFNADVASTGYYQGAVNHSQALGDSWRVHASVAASGQPDQHRTYHYTDPNTGDDASSERQLRFDSQTAVIKLTSDPDKTLSYYGGVYYDDNEYDGFYSAGTSGGPAVSVASRDVGGVDSLFSMAQGGARYRFTANTSAELKLYYFEQKRTFERSFTLNRNFVGVGDENDYGSSVLFKQSDAPGNTRWSLELATRRAVMGDYRRIVTTSSGDIVPALTGQLVFSNFARSTDSAALDAVTPLGSAEQLELHYGGRYDDYSDFGGEFSPRLGLVYKTNKEGAIKLLYGQAFRAPNAGEVKGFASIEASSGIEPEVIDTYELVFMQRTSRTISEVVLFKSRWTDAIVVGPTTTPGFVGKYVNSGTSNADGIEGTFTFHTAPWTLSANGSYVVSRNDTTEQNYVAFPKWILGAGIGYSFVDQHVNVSLNNRVHLGAKEGQIAATLPAPQPLKDYWRTDLHIEKQWSKQTQVWLDARNVFDRNNYLPSIQSNPSTGGLPEEEQSLMLGLTYQL